jgi:hypothetical protein
VKETEPEDAPLEPQVKAGLVGTQGSMAIQPHGRYARGATSNRRNASFRFFN